MNRLYCPKCGSEHAVCIEESGWHIHLCHSCGYEQTFTEGTKNKPEIPKDSH